jgi:transposase-like protein
MGKVTDDQKVRIVELYTSGESTLQIGQRLQVSPATVNRWLHRRGVVLRGPRETSTKCQICHNSFDELTPDAAYWIGFLFADGSVSSCGQSGTVSVRISECDRDHLVKLRAFLGSTHTISAGPAGNYGGYPSRPSARFSVRSARLAQQLLSLGRYEGPINDTLIQSCDFWRGVVDGDGSLGILATGYAYLGLVGSHRLLEAFLLFLKGNGLGARMTIRSDKTIFQVATAGYTAEKIVSFLYRNAEVALDRKAASAARIAAARDARLSAERSRLAQIADWYQGGASLKLIGSRLGVSDVTILRWMEKADIPRRGRHGGRRRIAPS